MSSVKALFKKIERFFGVNLYYIVHGGFWLGIDQVMAAFISILLSVAFGNLLSQETYGTYKYVLSFFSILTISTLPNMGIAVSTSAARGFEGLLGSAVKTRIRWGFLGAVLSVGIGSYYFYSGNPMIGAGFLIMAAFLPFMDPLNLYDSYLEGKKLFKIRSEYSILIRIVSAGSLIATLFFTKSLLFILLAYFIPYIVMRPIFFWLSVKEVPPNQKEDPNMLSYGKHLSILQLLAVGVNYLDNLLIFQFLGPVSLAIYSIANAPISKIQTGFSVLSDLALPKFSERSIDDIKKTLMGKMLKAEIVCIIMVLAYILAAPLLFHTFLPKYSASIFFTQLLALPLLAWPFGLIYTFLQAHALKSQIYQYNIATRIIQLILITSLVYFYGVMGAVLARVIFQFFAVIILLILFKRTK